MKRTVVRLNVRRALCAITLALLLLAGMLPARELQQYAVAPNVGNYIEKADFASAWGTVTGIDSEGIAIMASPDNATYQRIRFGTYDYDYPLNHWVAGTEDGGNTLVLYQANAPEKRVFNGSTDPHQPAGDFDYAANAAHWGMSDLRAYLNRGLTRANGSKTGLADTSGAAARSAYERKYYYPAESARLIPFAMNTIKDPYSDSFYTTVDRFSLPSGNWIRDEVISYGTQDVVKNTTFDNESPRNMIPRGYWTLGDSWLRSPRTETTAMTYMSIYTLSSDVDTQLAFPTISRIDISDALFAAPDESGIALRYRAKGALANARISYNAGDGTFSYSNVPADTNLVVMLPGDVPRMVAGPISIRLSGSGRLASTPLPVGSKFWLEQRGTGADEGLLFAKRADEDFVTWDKNNAYYSLQDLSGKALRSPEAAKRGDMFSFRLAPKAGYEGYKYTAYANGVRCNSSQGMFSFLVADGLTDITVVIESNEVPKYYDVTFPAGTGYTVRDAYETVLAGKHNLAGGTNLSFMVKLDSAYSNSALTVRANDTVLTPAGGFYSFQLFGDTEITVENVGMNTYPISLPTGSEYTVTDAAGKEISGIQHALYGSDFSFRIQPKFGYGGAVTVRSNGAPLTAVGGLYTIGNITQAQTVNVSLEGQSKYNIVIPSGAGFAVADGAGNLISGTQTVAHNGDFLFRVDAATGYEVTEVRVNGAQVFADGGTYALRNITEDKAITVTTSRKQYSLYFTAGEGYSVTDELGANSLGLKTVTFGDSYRFKVPVLSGYDGSNLAVYNNGERIAPDAQGVYTLSNIASDKIITFGGLKAITYTVTFVSGTGYSYKDYTGLALSTVTVEHGKSVSFEVNKAEAYGKDADYKVYANGVQLTGVGSYVLSNITANITVTVGGMDLNNYTVKYYLAGGGGLYPDRTATHGGSINLADPPTRDGYQFKGWQINGSMYPAGAAVTITGDTEVTALWTKVSNDIMPIWLILLIILAILAAILIIILVIRAIKKNKRNNATE